MELKTKVDISRKLLQLTHEDSMLLIGSCFADNIGGKLNEAHFDCCVNPFGTLYNPLSIRKALADIIKGRGYETGDAELFEHGGVWHSWMHHTRFSSTDKNNLVEKINTSINEAHEHLKKCSLLIVTLGSAYVYRLKDDARIVANCHKMNEKLFDRKRLAVDEIVGEWLPLLGELREMNPHIKVMFTVSPIRHKRDGFHANQLSKATLLLAADSLCEERSDMCLYFPAYEIMMDELRDYRFYADDMVHPSTLAVEYIWERFCDAFFNRKTMDKIAEWRKFEAAQRHRVIMAE